MFRVLWSRNFCWYFFLWKLIVFSPRQSKHYRVYLLHRMPRKKIYAHPYQSSSISLLICEWNNLFLNKQKKNTLSQLIFSVNLIFMLLKAAMKMSKFIHTNKYFNHFFPLSRVKMNLHQCNWKVNFCCKWKKTLSAFLCLLCFNNTKRRV